MEQRLGNRARWRAAQDGCVTELEGGGDAVNDSDALEMFEAREILSAIESHSALLHAAEERVSYDASQEAQPPAVDEAPPSAVDDAPPPDVAEREFTLDGEPAGGGRMRELTREEGLAAIESLRRALVLRTADAAQRTHRFVPSGLPEIDALCGGGFPRGRLAEVTGPPSSGRTALLLATAAAVTSRGEAVAWIDPGSALDVRAAEAAGVSLPYLLWVRPKTAASAWTAADIVLGTGGFTLVVIDVGEPPRAAVTPPSSSQPPRPGGPRVDRGSLADVSRASCPLPGAPLRTLPAMELHTERFDSFASREKREKKPALSLGAGTRPPAQVWTRLARGAERSGAAVVLLADRHLAGTFAALTLDLAPAERTWRGPSPSHAVLVGTLARCRVARNKLGPPEKTAVVGFGDVEAPPSPERRAELVRSSPRQSFASQLSLLEERSGAAPHFSARNK